MIELSNELLVQYISEQVALEEELFKVIEQQIAEGDDKLFPAAKSVLIDTKKVLEEHFIPLNKMLDELDQAASFAKEKKRLGTNGANLVNYQEREKANTTISQILCADYSALNVITMGNTLLHTTALALGAQEVATLALNHLKNLTPLVVKIGELVPHVVTQELLAYIPEIDPIIGSIALQNTQLAWRNTK